jgi:hypothetical protein
MSKALLAAKDWMAEFANSKPLINSCRGRIREAVDDSRTVPVSTPC